MSLSPWLGDELSYKIKENENFHEHSPQVAQDVIDGKLDMTTFVERLSGVLTDANLEYRVRGMLLFSKVLSSFPNDFLTEAQLHFISTFYIDRLKDNHRVIPPVIEGLLSIIKMRHLPRDVPSKILLGINQHVPCQQQVRTDRTVIYHIFRILIQNYNDEIKSMGPDLVYTIISAMDGERDPRNLMLVFTFLPDFLSTIPLAHLTEEMFEVIACYYPIDFNSPPDDPHAITRNDLADKLCVCLCASPEFAPFCLPLLLEKLDSDLKIAKLDSLKLLTQSCTTFKAESYDIHLPTIWTYLQKALTSKCDTDIRHAAHQSLRALINKLCSAEADCAIGETFMKQIINSMKISLADAKTKALLLQPLEVLLTSVRASKRSCLYITETCVPLLILHHHLNLDKHLQVSSFQWFSSMFNICKTWDVLPQAATIFAELPKMCLTGLNDENEQLKVSCFETLSQFTEIFDSNDIPSLCEIIDNHLCRSHPKAVDEACKGCLIIFSQRQPEIFRQFILEKLELDAVRGDLLMKRLDVLCSLISIDTYADMIMNKFIQLLQGSECNVETTNLLFSSFASNFVNKELFKDDCIAVIQKKYNIMQHVTRCISKDIELHRKTLQIISELITIIMRAMKSEEQYALLLIYVPEYLKKIHSSQLFVVVLEALLNSTRQDVNIDDPQLLVSCTMDLALNAEDTLVLHKSCLILANLLNKYIHNEQISLQYQMVKQRLSEMLEHNINNNCIILCSWICKSLLLNGHSESKFWLQQLIQMLYIDEWSLEAAKSFKVIMNETSDALDTSCFCKGNLLYKQKVFNLFSEITTALHGTLPKEHNKESYLVAYVYIIQAVPKTVIQMEASKISSILIESLSFTDPDLLQASLSTLSHLIENKNTCVAGSLQSLVPRALKLTSFNNSMHVRIAALQCLYNIASCYPTVVSILYKEDVVYQLASALDDPKRLVRGAAVKCRTRWFLVGAPGEDKLKS